MNPKQKAQDIYISNSLRIGSVNDAKFWAKLMSERDVAEIMIDLYYNYSQDDYISIISFWKDVKLEIEKI